MSKKVVIYGDLTNPSGYRTHSLNLARALSQRCQVSLRPIGRDRPEWDVPAELASLIDERPEEEPAVGIGISGPESLGELRGDYKIGYFAFETTKIPPAKLGLLSALNELWVPSRWCQATLRRNGFSQLPVKVVPEGVDPQVFRPGDGPVGRGEAVFRFLSVGKWEERKCQGPLIECFKEVFGDRDDVELVLHAHNPFLEGFDLDAAVRESSGGATNIVASGPLPEAALVELYNRADAFILPTRGEAWGLPIVEAMACALPVVATCYSGPRDYLNCENSFPLPVRSLVGVPASRHFPAGEDYGHWAEPNWRVLRGILRALCNRPERLFERGRAARTFVLNHATWQHAAAVAHENLTELL